MTHKTLNVDVVRALSAPPELRAAAAGDGSIGLLSGHFSTFGDWYRVCSMWEGDFMEQCAKGFTLDTIAEDRSGMRVLFDHGFDPQLGNKVLGPIQDLREDGTGPYYEVPMFDTSYNRDLLPGLKSGVYGASFRMRVTGEAWDDEPDPSDYNPKGIPERTITQARVMEFGPVTFPANPAASASVRSATDGYYEGLRMRDVRAFDDAVRSAGITLPTDQAVRSARSEADSGKDGEPGNGEQSEFDRLRERLNRSIKLTPYEIRKGVRL
jgi:hypothetical protein